MAIPPRFLADLRDRLTLSELIGRKVRLVRAGREFKGCCPFHQEKSPSFYVNDDKQFYHCFGCGAHGDAVGFVMQHDNLSFIDAVESLAGQAGMQVPQQSPREVEQARREKDIYSLMNEAASFFEAQLRVPAQREVLQYARERGMAEETLAAFRVGFAPADGQALRAHLKVAGYSDAQMMEGGLLRKSERGGESYSFFRDRLIFPVSDRRGRVVAFGGRILPEHMRPPDREGFKPPKYINSGETALFHKGRMLYAESRARAAASDGKPVLVVEGYMDVIACWQGGFPGAVAPLGTALTEEQILALWKMIPATLKEPVLCFDGDEAGRRAASRAASNLLPLLKPGHSARIAFLPQGQDPDSLMRGSGPPALQAVIDAAIPLADFVWQLETHGGVPATPEARAALEQAPEARASKIADRTVQTYYRKAFRDRLFAAFRPVFNRGGRPPPAAPVTRLASPRNSGVRVCQLAMLAAAINHPDIFDAAEEDLAALVFDDGRLDALRQAVLNALSGEQEGKALDADGLRRHLVEQGFEDELKSVLSDGVYARAPGAGPAAGRDGVLAGWAEMQAFLAEQALIDERRGQMRGPITLHGISKRADST